MTLSSYEYDDLGRVSRKMLHNDVDTTTHTYDIAGGKLSPFKKFRTRWGFEHVETGLSGKVTPRYNGNVSHIKWETVVMSPTCIVIITILRQLTGAYLYKKSGTT